MEALEYSESSTITFEWTLKGLKNLFDSSKGDTKSKVCKSVKFGGGRWQVLFYPNSGHEGGFVSLYLSCEPTEDEKERAVDAKWVREGLFKFSFELRNVNRGTLSPQKEAPDHAFSYKTANWGWAQFAKRDTVFYSSNIVRHVDAFLIICNITAAPVAPSPMPPVPVKSVPRSLMDSIGSMLDDPTYSDVQFVLPARRGRDGRARPARSIFAAKRILQRVEYFDLMFSSGFAEGAASPAPSTVNGYAPSDHISISVVDQRENDEDGYFDYDVAPFDDSDQSDEEPDDMEGRSLDRGNADTPVGESFKPLRTPSPPTPSQRRLARDSMLSLMSGTTAATPYDPANDDSNDARQDLGEGSLSMDPSTTVVEASLIGEAAYPSPPGAARRGGSPLTRQQDVDPALTAPLPGSPPSRGSPSNRGGSDNLNAARRDSPSPGRNQVSGAATYNNKDGRRSGSTTSPSVSTARQSPPQKHLTTSTRAPPLEKTLPGPRKTKVVVKECEYATYYAVLYYLYTDAIVFCPLTSEFLTRANTSLPSSPRTRTSPPPNSNALAFRNGSNSLHLMTSGNTPSFASFPSTPFSSAFGSTQSQSGSTTYQQFMPSHGRQPSGGGSHQWGRELGDAVHKSRREWVRSWMAANPGRPAPCSAKACYRLADKLGLTELRARAFHHIVKSLTVSNVPYEVFSSFSATFEEVRKVQVDFFLANWSQIKTSEAMRNVFQQIRLGRHPGFEEVWPLIIMNLEYNPRPSNENGQDGGREGVGF